MRTRLYLLSVSVASIAAYFYLTSYFWWVNDDAFISFRYARNLASGVGLRYNFSETVPVEGYSNLLWVLLAALGIRLATVPEVLMPILSLICGVALIFTVWLTSKDHLSSNEGRFSTILFLALFPPFAIWSTSGLETMCFSLFFFLTFYLTHFSKQVSIFLIGVASALFIISRPEAFAWGSLMVVTSAFARWPNRKELKKVTAPFAAIIILTTSGYFCWRLNYHGFLLPNTAYAKSGLDLGGLVRGANYVITFFLTFPATLLVLLWASFRVFRFKERFFVSMLFYAIAIPAYAVVVGGDFMAMGRFLIPATPFWALLIGGALDRLSLGGLRAGAISALLLVFNLFPVWNLHIIPENIRAKFHFRLNSKSFRSEYEQWRYMKANANKWRKLGLALKARSKPDQSLVAGAIGAVGYYSSLTIYDRFGLVTPEVAHGAKSKKRRSPGHDRTVPYEFFLDRNPTFLYATIINGRAVNDKLAKAKVTWERKGKGYIPISEILERDKEGEPKELLFLVKRSI